VDSWDFQLADGPWGHEPQGRTPGHHHQGHSRRRERAHRVGEPSLRHDHELLLACQAPIPPMRRGSAATRCTPSRGPRTPRTSKNLKVAFYNDAGNKVRPGRAGFNWDSVPGAAEYALDIATANPACKAGAGVIESHYSQAEPVVAGYVDPLDAAEHYFVNVHAIGPPASTSSPRLEPARSSRSTRPRLRTGRLQSRGQADHRGSRDGRVRLVRLRGHQESQISYYNTDAKGSARMTLPGTTSSRPRAPITNVSGRSPAKHSTSRISLAIAGRSR